MKRGQRAKKGGYNLLKRVFCNSEIDVFGKN